jgi:hypothetical protein
MRYAAWRHHHYRLRKTRSHAEQCSAITALPPAATVRQRFSVPLGLTQPAAQASAKILAMLPKAAELYRKQVAQGLDRDPRAALKARVFLREWFTGKIRLEPLPDGGLMAHWNQQAAALLRGVGTGGSGGALCAVPAPLNLALPLV